MVNQPNRRRYLHTILPIRGYIQYMYMFILHCRAMLVFYKDNCKTQYFLLFIRACGVNLIFMTKFNLMTKWNWYLPHFKLLPVPINKGFTSYKIIGDIFSLKSIERSIHEELCQGNRMNKIVFTIKRSLLESTDNLLIH